MKRSDRKRLQERKDEITRRLDRHNYPSHGGPVLAGGNVHYEVSGRARGMNFGGVGAIHAMVRQLGLTEMLNRRVRLLKIYNPYMDSDHILSLVYNVLTGGTRLEDLEGLREQAAYLDALGAERIPDPTTAGDYLRRFTPEFILLLMETVNEVRLAVWDQKAARDSSFYDEAVLEVDGSIVETLGECKGGMDISYNGVWGYAPLIITLANTGEPLYIVNRPGNAASHQDAGEWIERAIALVKRRFKKVTLRGDTAFSLTRKLDKWDEQGRFVLGYDARANLIEHAKGLETKAWKPFQRKPKYTVATTERARPQNIKEKIVRERGFKNLRLCREDVAEFPYRPAACKKTYRMVVVRKTITVEQGQLEMFDEIRHFFYITNDRDAPAEEIVFEANRRCNQENIIAQLKNGINALRAPVDDLTSNWAYMAIASMALTFKAWFGLLAPDAKVGDEIVRMEHKTFLHNFIALPCQIVRAARRVVVRIVGYTRYLEPFLDTWEVIRRLRPV